MAKKKQRGDRSWTPEQREILANRQREMHRVFAEYQRGVELKGKGVKRITLEALMQHLETLVSNGAPADSRVEFLPSCCDGVEIIHEKTVVSGRPRDTIVFR